MFLFLLLFFFFSVLILGWVAVVYLDERLFALREGQVQVGSHVSQEVREQFLSFEKRTKPLKQDCFCCVSLLCNLARPSSVCTLVHISNLTDLHWALRGTNRWKTGQIGDNYTWHLLSCQSSFYCKCIIKGSEIQSTWTTSGKPPPLEKS